MASRKKISASLRWSVFARDGFCCRYCGRQAGQDGVELHADHVVSLADGGDDSFDNLVTACQQCNGGKAARSLSEIPAPEEVVRRVKEMRGRMDTLAQGVSAAIESRKALEQEIVNLKCEAYGYKSVKLANGEMTTAIKLLHEFGPEKLMEWYKAASDANVGEWKSIRYVCGCARNHREMLGISNG